jgi:hypothetical protein
MFERFSFHLKSLEHLFLSHHSSGIPRGFRPPTAVVVYILRPFLPTVHFDGGGAAQPF